MKARLTPLNYIILICFLSISNFGFPQNIEQQIDTYLEKNIESNTPGAAILVAKDGNTIYSKAFGMADLELNVKAEPKNVFEIGSITKQFTAVAILMLEERGELSLEDNIIKYIPDYPTHGQTITIHNLLNHTSGIKSYTNMPNFIENSRIDMTPTELIDVFKNEPMEFESGTAFNYNNSGYILLGHIIEVVSGNSYAEFLQANIFDKLEMENSYYGSMVNIIPNRASGYSETESGYANAAYLSLTLPYAAGSIMSTTADLLKWQNAMSANTLIKKSSWDKATNGSKLLNGDVISYGYGWDSGNINGSKTIEHSGGIFGFTSNGIFLPEENVYVIGLSNCDCGSIGALTSNVAAMAIGKPFQQIEDAISLSEAELEKWVGAYKYEGDVIRHITRKDNKLFSQREGSTNLEIYPMSKTNFIFDGGATSYVFYMENDKRMAKFTSNGNTIIGTGIDKSPPAEQKSINLPQETLMQYVGKYQLAPTFHIVIDVRDGKVFTTATGQQEIEIYASEKDEFFLKVVPAKIVFNRNSDDVIESLTLFQSGQELLGKKVE